MPMDSATVLLLYFSSVPKDKQRSGFNYNKNKDHLTICKKKKTQILSSNSQISPYKLLIHTFSGSILPYSCDNICYIVRRKCAFCTVLLTYSAGGRRCEAWCKAKALIVKVSLRDSSITEQMHTDSG